MKIKNINIGIQLISAFAIIIMFFAVLGWLAYRHNQQLKAQAEIMYQHPLLVRNAIGEIEIGILKMRLDTRNIMLLSDKAQQEKQLREIQTLSFEIDRNFDLLEQKYLGNTEDIRVARDAYMLWNNARQKIILSGMDHDIQKVMTDVADNGEIGLLRNDMLRKIKKVSDFSFAKATYLYTSSQKNAADLILFILVVSIILILSTLIMGYLLKRNIQEPLLEIKNVVLAYRRGEFTKQSSYVSTNEIGLVAQSINELLEKVNIENQFATKSEKISGHMLVEENAHSFFKRLLPVLASETNSQMAAYYMLNSEKTKYYLYESIGITPTDTNTEFYAQHAEGEFGLCIASKSIQIIHRIPKDTIFVYKTVSGGIVPREMINIPILKGSEVVGVLALASIRQYEPLTVQFIYKIQDILTARFDGIMAHRRISKYATMLAEQNQELEMQAKELQRQSDELTMQNAELEMQKNQLQQANQLKTNFLSTMSHELRTPLNSIIALSGVLHRTLKQEISDEQHNYLAIIERNGKLLLSLINDILDIARIESGRVEIELTSFDARATINEVMEMISHQAKANNTALTQEHDTSPLLIRSDASKFRHIIQNLVANAIKFTENGSVHINIKVEENSLKVCIQDTGIGIAPEHIDHIFDEFRQADGSTSRRFGGSGLGLAIARKYARLLGGNIEVSSVLNQGSIFCLWLPYHTGETPVNNLEQPLPIALEHPTSTDVKTILLVEDSEAAIVQLRYFLEGNNYKVIATNSGEEAIDLLNNTMPDGIILDLMMPGMDGFEVLEKIRNNEKTSLVPVLILTAKHISKDELQFLKQNNIHQLIQKGDVKKEHLLQAVDAMVKIDGSKKQ
ncbi:MAG: hypothetical protein AUK44_06610 [Porphyromonadaceae bacterium CG2_30_38_12]|nr:MAG: hypothetical protein AUK44_06610 [Porphyromonadaceae bacterium CG2_30_38_12]